MAVTWMIKQQRDEIGNLPEDSEKRGKVYKPDEECRQLIMAIKAICTEKGIKPHTLAQKAGISTSTMSYLMNGKTNPQLYTLLAICNVLDVSINDLLSTGKQDGSEESWEDEKKLLSSYRKLSPKKRRLLTAYTEMLSDYQDGDL